MSSFDRDISASQEKHSIPARLDPVMDDDPVCIVGMGKSNVSLLHSEALTNALVISMPAAW